MNKYFKSKYFKMFYGIYILIDIISRIFERIESHWSFYNLVSKDDNTNLSDKIPIEQIYSELISQYQKPLWLEISSALLLYAFLGFILFVFLKYKKLSEQTISNINYSNKHWCNEINKISKQITNNLNDSHYTNDLKIRYVDLRLENKNLSNDDFIRVLNENGYSKEDLEKIGVNNKFLKMNKSKLLPKKIIDKYKEFKIELEKHKLNQENEYNRDNK